MTAPLSLSRFTDRDVLHRAEFFGDDDVFAYLAKHLEARLTGLLGDLGVRETPVIEGEVHAAAIVEGQVYIAPGATVEATALIRGPTYIGPGTQVRHGAYVRGNVYAGANAVIGHATEAKGAVFLDGAQAGHFAYVGDSILGQRTNLGAGTKLANLKLSTTEVRYRHPDDDTLVSSGLRKLGAILGDRAQTGCNAVLNPGSLLLPGTLVVAGQSFLGTLNRGVYRGPS